MNDSVRVLIVGCGNLLRGDDAVGPILVRHLWDRGVPHGVLCRRWNGRDGCRISDAGRATRHHRGRLPQRLRTRRDFPTGWA